MPIIYTFRVQGPMTDELLKQVVRLAEGMTVRTVVAGETIQGSYVYRAQCLLCGRSSSGYLASVEHWESIHRCEQGTLDP